MLMKKISSNYFSINHSELQLKQATTTVQSANLKGIAVTCFL